MMTKIQTQIRFLKFSNEEAHARLTVWDDDTATLSGVYSRSPGQGFATKVLRSIEEYADTHNLDLYLDVQSYGPPRPDTLDNQQLIEFYRRFGFTVYDNYSQPVIMRRRPAHL